jgi:outer membrane lipoprotein LolB
MWFAASRTDPGSIRSRLFWSALLLSTLAGCATTRPATVTPATPWAARREALTKLDRWQLEGKIGINAGREGGSGTFSWQQAGDALDFRFRGPLGAGGFRIYGDDDRLRVKTTEGEEFELVDPERELRERYGWSVPLRSMRYWMLGVPDPHGEAAETLDDAQQNLALLQQNGWTVQYGGYSETAGMLLPRKLTMDGDGIRVRVVVERWQIGE